MPIRFRCMHCRGLMAISSRMSGAIVDCPTCGEKTLVPNVEEPPAEVPAEVPAQPVPKEQAETSAAILSKEQPGRVEELPNDELAQTTIGHVAKPAAEPVEATNTTIHDAPSPSHGDPMLDIPLSKVETGPASVSTVKDNSEDDEPFIPSELEEDDNGGLTIRRHNNLDEEMDLTPMVDVTFQLLIFFMVSASFSLQKSIEVPIPDPDQQGAAQQVQTMDDIQGTSIVVRIDGSNSITIDDEPLNDANRLVDTLRDKMRREQKNELLVTAHSLSLHRTIISIIDAANEIGIQKIRMTSHKKVD